MGCIELSGEYISGTHTILKAFSGHLRPHSNPTKLEFLLLIYQRKIETLKCQESCSRSCVEKIAKQFKWESVWLPNPIHLQRKIYF